MVAEPGSAVLGEIALDVPSSSESLSLVRSVVRRVVDFDTFDEQSGFLVAVGEVFTNAVAAQRRAPVREPIRVVVSLGVDRCIRIEDQGNGFPGVGDEPTAPPEPVAMGRGLLIARAFVPDLTIVSSTAGTSVTLPIRSS
ncbi:MAG: ATP-binding protein [Actinomycetota bacterium]